MGLLIRHAVLMTMTGTGELMGDLLIQNGRIERLAEQIDPAEYPGTEILEARKLTVLPGMIDLTIHEDTYPTGYLSRIAVAAGITTILVRREGSDGLTLVSGDDCRMPPAGLQYFSVSTEADWQRVTEAAEGAQNRPIIYENAGSVSCSEMIAVSRCAVVLTAQRGTGSPWELAAALDARSIQVAVGSCFPRSQMKLLPIYAGFCHRAGMPRIHALRTITSTPADILGLSDRGRIKPGCRADLAIFDGDPMLLSTSHVMTILGGRIVRKS